MKDKRLPKIILASRLQWKVNKANSLTLTYRYNYLYDRGISIDDTHGKITLTNKYTTKHLILLAYKFGW